jgi:hypothetical protein
METTGIEPATSWLQIVECSGVKRSHWVVNPNVDLLYTKSRKPCNSTHSHLKASFRVVNLSMISGNRGGFQGSIRVVPSRPAAKSRTSH